MQASTASLQAESSNTTAGPSAAAGSSTSASNTQQQAPQSLEELLQFLLSEQEITAIDQTLKNFSTKETRDTILASILPSGQDPLELLHPEANTLGFLYILSARLNVSGAPPPQLAVVEAFCRSFNPAHARLSPARVTALAKGIIHASGDNLKYAITSLRDLITRYPPNLSYLTTIHPIFLNACVSTRNYAPALPILATPILNIDLTISPDLNYNDNLIYHYAGGIVYGALKKWREAEGFFEIVTTAPGQVPSALQAEGLKKLTLVQLILHGKALPPPKFTNPILVRQYKALPYFNFTKSYPQMVDKLESIVAKEEELYKTEKNWGLIQQAIAHAPRWLIKKLTLVYHTLSLGDIASQIGISNEDEVRALVLDMVEAGMIAASISASGTVTFSDSASHSYSKKEIDQALTNAQEQSQLLLQLEREMNLSKDYIAKALKHKDEAWGATDEEMYSTPSGGGWGDDF